MPHVDYCCWFQRPFFTNSPVPLSWWCYAWRGRECEIWCHMQQYKLRFFFCFWFCWAKALSAIQIIAEPWDERGGEQGPKLRHRGGRASSRSDKPGHASTLSPSSHWQPLLPRPGPDCKGVGKLGIRHGEDKRWIGLDSHTPLINLFVDSDSTRLGKSLDSPACVLFFHFEEKWNSTKFCDHK